MRERLGEGNEDDEGGRMRRERALDEVVKDERGAGLDAVLDEEEESSLGRVGIAIVET